MKIVKKIEIRLKLNYETRGNPGECKFRGQGSDVTKPYDPSKLSRQFTMIICHRYGRLHGFL